MRTTVTFEAPSAALADEWRRVYGLSETNFFLSPTWIETWLGGAPDETKIGIVRAFDDLRGVFALALIGAPPRTSFAGFSQSRLHETGDDAYDRIYIEYNDFLIAATAPPETRREMIGAIIDAQPRVEEFVFRNVRQPVSDALEDYAQVRGFDLRTLMAQPTFQIDLTVDGAPLLDRYSSSLRAKLRRAIRRYEERGELKLTRAAPGHDRSVAWTELMRLHEQTWSRRGMIGVFRGQAFIGFHERLLDRHADFVDLIKLTVGGETIGVLYNFIADGRVYNYQSGFRYESDNQLVPGFVCHALAAEKYRVDGFKTYDMMGGEAEYKRRMGVEGETLKTVVVTRRGLKSMVRSFVNSLRPVRSARTRQT